MLNTQPILLGVNIDHVATLRQQRHTRYPDPVEACYAAEQGGADGITIHLREDRRHIQERDVRILQETLQTRMNLECAVTPEMLRLLHTFRPMHCCFVPEKRQELTTEGGLNILNREVEIHAACVEMKEIACEVSLFIDPDHAQIEAAKRCDAPVIELHTGAYAEAKTAVEQSQELARIVSAVNYAASLGLVVNAGHGLHYQNTAAIAAIGPINELNIGHAIVAKALFVGLEKAVRDMKQLMLNARIFHSSVK
jgi:pyridoxine 5-phosphate synthase